MSFLFPFSILSIPTAMTVTLTIKTEKAELLKRETERIHFAFYTILLKVSLAHVGKKHLFLLLVCARVFPLSFYVIVDIWLQSE